MSPLLRIPAETHKILKRCFGSLTEKFRSKNGTKLFLLWNLNHFKHNPIRNIQSQSLKPGEILVYEHSNTKFISRLKFLSAAQYVVWISWGLLSYDNARQRYLKCKESEEKEVLKGARQMKLIMNLMAIACLLGTVALFSVWAYLLRTVKSIKVNKAVRRMVIETYTPLIKGRELEVPFHYVSGGKSRFNNKSGTVPLKIKGRYFYYLVDTKGNFKDETTFDNIVALERDLDD